MREIVEVLIATEPISARVRPPGSKSTTIRALVAGALASGRSHLYGPLVADDIQAMLGALRAFGVDVRDPEEPWTVHGTGGHLVAPANPIDAGESGLTARIAMSLATLAEGTTVIDGRGRLRQRPMDGLVEALIAQGVAVVSSNGLLPVTISGQGGLWGSTIDVDCSKSSQFATALLLTAPLTTEPSTIRINGLTGAVGYLDLTIQVMEAFGARVLPNITGFEVSNNGYQPADYVVEPDASAAVYPMVAAAITGGSVEIDGLPLTSRQPDTFVAHILADMGCHISDGDSGLIVDAHGVGLRPIEAEMSGAPDGALGIAVACLFAGGESRIRGLSSLQYKESDRLSALTSELSRLGGEVSIDRGTLIIRPRSMSSATIDPHGDHRIAMAAALVGLQVPGVKVAHPEVVNKTWPGYWQMLAGLSTG